MAESISPTIKQKGLTLDDVFTEVQHTQNLGLPKANQLRLFHTDLHGNKLSMEGLEQYIYRNLARYVFSRAALENYRINDDEDASISQAMKIMADNAGEAGTGSMLDEVLIYAFLEEKLKAPKLMSRVELHTEMPQFKSECKGVHLLSPKDLPTNTKFQMVFGASDIVNDMKNAIDQAFDEIKKIDDNERLEIQMVQKTVLNLFFDKDEIQLLNDVIVPQQRRKNSFDVAYGLFLGYKLGLNPSGRGDEYDNLVEKKMKADIKEHASYIVQKIHDYHLEGHSFYVYVVPFDEAEDDKTKIMDDVLKGGVIL